MKFSLNPAQIGTDYVLIQNKNIQLSRAVPAILGLQSLKKWLISSYGHKFEAYDIINRVRCYLVSRGNSV